MQDLNASTEHRPPGLPPCACCSTRRAQQVPDAGCAPQNLWCLPTGGRGSCPLPQLRRLEHKGKAATQGPEQRRGRPDLTEILQQKSNPYKDGRSLGDQW